MSLTQRFGTINLLGCFVGCAWLLLPLRIANPTVNQIATLMLFFSIPFSLGLAVCCLPRRLSVRIAASVPLFVASLLFMGLVFLSSIAGGPIAVSEVLDSVRLSHSRIVAYRINGGATTSYSVRIVQEMQVFPGIVIFKDLHQGYREYTATLLINSAGSVVATIDEVPTEFRVRPFVLF
jgi:hypothetical protein